MNVTTQWSIKGAVIALLCSAAFAQNITELPAMPLDTLLSSLERAQAKQQSQASYQVIRQYRLAGLKYSKADSEVVAEVNFSPPSSEGYTIQKYSGSSRGQQLVRSILDHEIEVTAKKDKNSSAITRANYDFTYVGEAMLDGKACYVLGLKPKRTERDLITGQAWIDKQSFLVRQVDGLVGKTPSWWLKTLRVKLEFDDMQGVWVQKSMEATADVRLVGAHVLTSRILDYRRQDELAANPMGKSRRPKALAVAIHGLE